MNVRLSSQACHTRPPSTSIIRPTFPAQRQGQRRSCRGAVSHPSLGPAPLVPRDYSPGLVTRLHHTTLYVYAFDTALRAQPALMNCLMRAPSCHLGHVSSRLVLSTSARSRSTVVRVRVRVDAWRHEPGPANPPRSRWHEPWTQHRSASLASVSRTSKQSFVTEACTTSTPHRLR